MTKPTDDDDRIFRQLIGREFGELLPAAAPTPRPSAPEPGAGAASRDVFSFAEAMERADPAPDEIDRFVPPEPEPLQLAAMRMRTKVGIALLAQAGVAAMLAVVGFRLPGWMGAISGLAAAGGLATLLLAIPRQRDDDDDGARL